MKKWLQNWKHKEWNTTALDRASEPWQGIWVSDLPRDLKAEVRQMTQEERKAFFASKSSDWLWRNVWLPSWRKERTRILTPTYVPILGGRYPSANDEEHET